MRIKFPAELNLDDYRKFTKRDNVLIFRYTDEYSENIRKELRRIVEENRKRLKKSKPLVETEVLIDVHYKARTLDQNAWLWASHELEARLINGKNLAWRDSKGITWYGNNAVTAQDVHDSYNERYAPRGYIEVEPGFVDAVRSMVQNETGRVMKETQLSNGKIQFEIWKTSSYLNVREFVEYSEHVKENLLSYGIDLDNAADYNTLLDDLEKVTNRQQLSTSVDGFEQLTQNEKSDMIEINTENAKVSSIVDETLEIW